MSRDDPPGATEGTPDAGTTRETLEKHVEAALETATDEEARFHLRHAKQLLIDLRTGAADADATETPGEERV